MLQTLLNRLSQSPRIWGALRRIAENGFQTERVIIERELVPAGAGAGRAYLDFGCGTGEFAACFPPGTYTGFDIARHYVRFAARERSGRYAVMSGGALGFVSGHFDGALVLGVFHHLPDDLVRASVAELHRVLRPGARLLVMEDIPSPEPWNVLGHLMHWLDRGDHIRTDADYRSLLMPHFTLCRTYKVRSGICDLAVYVLDRADEIGREGDGAALKSRVLGGDA
ncbi:MAG: class I SAM-dependent methyltransferase [Chloroflexota bacterium]|nr:MAG: methyltransferase type 11 [Chloroflexota bacterium]